MKTISILNLKGGVGKTTSAIHLAYYLVSQKKRTLLIDLDGQCNLTQFYNVEVSKTDNVYRLFDDKEIIDPTMIDRRLYILPSNVKTSKVDINIATEPDMIYILPKVLNSEKYQSIFDYIIIDCPPSVGLIVLNALTASTHILIPLTAGEYAYEGLKASMNVAQSIKNSYNPKLEILGILPTMISTRTRASQNILEKHNSDGFSEYTLNNHIRYSEAFKRAEIAHKTIWEFNSKSPAASDMMNACQEICNRIKKK